MARQDDEREAVYVISVAASLTGVHPQTLRIYERKGLIFPYRTPGGTRRYSQADLDRLSAILELTAAGVNLEGVRRILELRSEVERLDRSNRQLRKQLADVKEAAKRELQRMGRALRSEVVALRRHLPDVRRPPLEDLFD